jgi:hypothetical protein
VVGAIVLGEKLTPTHALGGGMILAGILLHGWARRAAHPRPSACGKDSGSRSGTSKRLSGEAERHHSRANAFADPKISRDAEDYCAVA